MRHGLTRFILNQRKIKEVDEPNKAQIDTQAVGKLPVSIIKYTYYCL